MRAATFQSDRVLALAAALALTAMAFGQAEPTAPSPPAATPARPTLPSAPTYNLGGANGGFQFLLKALVDRNGQVQYDKLTRSTGVEAGLLEATIEAYAKIPLPEDPKDRLAMWCNAYNVNVIHMAFEESRKSDFAGVDKIQGFFSERTITVCGEKMTLDTLEKERIVPMGDARAHAALVCGAMSCPPLRREAYVGERLDEQLDDQCKRWINDPARNGVEGDALSLSKALDWYKADFEGKPYGGVIGFVRHHADPDGEIAKLLARVPKPEIRWKPWDWTLNRAAPGGGTTRPAPAEPPKPAPADTEGQRQ